MVTIHHYRGAAVTGAGIDGVLAAVRAALPRRPGAVDVPALRARGALLVDIRPVELRDRDGELPGAVVIDRNVLEWRLDPTSPHRIPEATGPDLEIVLVCNEGYASSIAAASLQRLGLHRATDLDGGYQAIVKAGSPTAEPANPGSADRSHPRNQLEHGAGGIGGGGQATVRGAFGRLDDRAAQLDDLGQGGVGVGHAEIHRPVGRNALG